MSQTSANVIAGNDAKASDHNAVVADLAEIYAGGPGVPVGGVIYWWSDNTVPLNYKVCDGTAVSDVSSPLNGLNTPNLIDRFVRGVANANIRSSIPSGGQDSVTLTVNNMPSHFHDIIGFMPNFNVWNKNDNSTAFNINDFSGDRIAVADNALNGVNGDNINKTTQSTGGGVAFSNIPAYRGLVPIVRIK